MKDRIVLKAVKNEGCVPDCAICHISNLIKDVCADCKDGYMYTYDSKQGWISVDDRLPETYKKVIGFYRKTWNHGKPISIETAYCNHNGWANDVDGDIKPTHWQPLPEPPKAKPVCPECNGVGGYYQKNPDCKNCEATEDCYDAGKEVCNIMTKCDNCTGTKESE